MDRNGPCKSRVCCLYMMRTIKPGALIATGGPPVDLRRRSCAPSAPRREPTRHANVRDVDVGDDIVQRIRRGHDRGGEELEQMREPTARNAVSCWLPRRAVAVSYLATPVSSTSLWPLLAARRRISPRLWLVVDRNGPCKSRWLGYFVVVGTGHSAGLRLEPSPRLHGELRAVTHQTHLRNW